MGKAIKHVNDLILGILMIGVSAFLFFGKITQSEVQTAQGGFLARPDIWLRMMAVFLFVVSVILIIRSINFSKSEEVDKFSFYIDSTVIATVLSLIAYAVALPWIGFFVSTYTMTFYLVMLYSVKEKGWNFNSVPKGNWGKILVKSLITAAILLVVFWFVFGKLLAIQLPGMEILYVLGLK